MTPSPKELALKIAEILYNKKAQNIEVLEVGVLSTLTQFFVIAGGNTTTQVKALADETEDKLSEIGIVPSGKEGYRSAGWVLLNYDSVLVHIFTPEMRTLYQLERLWGDAPALDLTELFDENK